MTFWYLATPYSKYPDGIDAAFRLAVDACGLLIYAKVPVFSPIAHTHPIAMLCDMNPFDHALWLPSDAPMMQCAHGLIMLRATGWQESYGMQIEQQFFAAAGKPIVWMDVGVLPDEFKSTTK